MTIDERLEKLTERHEALTQSVEGLTADVKALTATVDKMAAHTKRIERIWVQMAGDFNTRLQALEAEGDA